ncbi:MAG: carboxypeptidase-like regulatory domain-containing protein [Planctomycetota bacterium]|nr:carboxypeptidase-like regulatory domain-containing protein [Planctomycetota bacterium]
MRPILVLVVLVLIALAAWLAFERGPGAVALVPTPAPTSAQTALEGELAPAGSPVALPIDLAPVRIEAATAADAAAAVPGPTRILARVTAIETGEPLEHVFVTAWRDGGTILATPQEIETDEEGLAEIEVEPGVPLIVSAQGDGRNTATANVPIPALTPGERRSVALSILTREDLVVCGVVLRRDTREPIAGVGVEAVAMFRGGPAPRANTANDGTFRIAVRSFATASLRYKHPEFGTALSPARAGHEGPASALEILLEPSASIRALVDAAGGADTRGWTAVASTPPWTIEQPSGSWVSGPNEVSWIATVDGGGVVVLPRLPAHAPLGLTLRRGSTEVWHAREPIVLAPGEARSIEINMGGGGIHGVVREADGSPAAGVRLRAVAAPANGSGEPADFENGTAITAHSEPDGAYRFDGLEPGGWLVGPALLPSGQEDPRRDPAPTAVRVEFEHPDVDVRHDIVLVRGVAIAGRVVHADGRAGKGAWVAADARETWSVRGVWADADGSFVIGPLRKGPWAVRAIAAGGLASEPAVVDAGREDLVLTLVEQATLCVEVQDESGLPIADAPVTLVHADGRGDARTIPTDASGIATFLDMDPVAYHLAASTDDGRFGAGRDLVPAGSGVTRVVLVARPGGRARLRFDGPGDSGVALVVDRGLLVQTGSLVRGKVFEITGPLGDVELQVHVGGKRYDKRVALGREPGADIVFDGGWR